MTTSKPASTIVATTSIAKGACTMKGRNEVLTMKTLYRKGTCHPVRQACGGTHRTGCAPHEHAAHGELHGRRERRGACGRRDQVSRNGSRQLIRTASTGEAESGSLECDPQSI